jgi:hypothetical protein
MADQDVRERTKGSHAPEQFKNAAKGNVVRQAGEGFEIARAAIPVPGSRLTAAEVQAEVGRAPRQRDAETRRVGGEQDDAAVKAEEREALQRQGKEDTDSKFEPETRTQEMLGVEDSVITANPD